MPQMIFVNLPVRDVARATAFYTGLGYEQNQQFSGDDGSAIVMSDIIFVMLLSETYFGTFTPRPVADATAATEVINALSVESREAVDHLLEKALSGGGKETRDPLDDFMYSRAFQDLDGHIWEIFYMDPANVDSQ